MNVKAYKILRSTSLDELELKILEHIGGKWELYGTMVSTALGKVKDCGGDSKYINQYAQAVYKWKD